MSPNALYLQTPLRGLSNFLFRHSKVLLAVLLGPPLLWFVVIYLGSLLALLWQGFYSFDDFSMTVLPKLTLDNYLKYSRRPISISCCARWRWHAR